MCSTILLQRPFLRFDFLFTTAQSKANNDHWEILSELCCQVLREEEFAPVKNANGATYDTPDSARLMLLRLHSRWVVAAGGFLTHSVPLYMTGNSCPYIHVSKICQLCKNLLDWNSLIVIETLSVHSGVEVSPLCSYAGENLEAICRGRTFHAPSEISF